jgi:peroxiredoxin
MSKYVSLTPGEPGPWFRQRSLSRQSYVLDTTGGRYLVLCFFGSAADRHAHAALRAVRSRPQFFNDETACFFGVTNDPADEREKRIAESIPGYRYFLDFDGAAGRLYGAVPVDADPGKEKVRIRRMWVVLDPTLRILRVIPFAADQADIAELLQYLDSLPPPIRFAGFEVHPPILVLPNVFEPEFCEKLIGLYEEHGGQETGFMRDVGGKTVMVNDHSHKRRRDYIIEDGDIIKQTVMRFKRRVTPEILKVHQFQATRMERYIVSCYAAEDEAHFRAHRDNTTRGTAHRRFAASVNLNDDFDGGEVSFPEYGPRGFKAPKGGAVVFSCSLLHAVSKVRRGRRYAFLPFLYDETAAQIREANAKFLEGGEEYKSGLGSPQDGASEKLPSDTDRTGV